MMLYENQFTSASFKIIILKFLFYKNIITLVLMHTDNSNDLN